MYPAVESGYRTMCRAHSTVFGDATSGFVCIVVRVLPLVEDLYMRGAGRKLAGWLRCRFGANLASTSTTCASTAWSVLPKRPTLAGPTSGQPMYVHRRFEVMGNVGQPLCDESASVCALPAMPTIGRLCPLAFKLTQTGCVEAFREALVAWVRFKRQRRMNACKVCNTALASLGSEGSCCKARCFLLTRGCGRSGHHQCRGADQERAGVRRVRCGPARHHVRDPMCVFSSIRINNLRHCVS
jgi:hypothetical protein